MNLALGSGDSSEVWSHPLGHAKFEASLGYMRLSHKKLINCNLRLRCSSVVQFLPTSHKAVCSIHTHWYTLAHSPHSPHSDSVPLRDQSLLTSAAPQQSGPACSISPPWPLLSSIKCARHNETPSLQAEVLFPLLQAAINPSLLPKNTSGLDPD